MENKFYHWADAKKKLGNYLKNVITYYFLTEKQFLFITVKVKLSQLQFQEHSLSENTQIIQNKEKAKMGTMKEKGEGGEKCPKGRDPES